VFAYDEFFETPDIVRAGAGRISRPVRLSSTERRQGCLPRSTPPGSRTQPRVVYTSAHGDNVVARGLWANRDLQDRWECAARGPAWTSAGARATTPVQPARSDPFIWRRSAALGLNVTPAHPCHCITEVLAIAAPLIAPFSLGIHGIGSKTAAYSFARVFTSAFIRGLLPQTVAILRSRFEALTTCAQSMSKPVLDDLADRSCAICDPD